MLNANYFILHSPFQEEAYTLFFTNQNWYLFLRLHAILCERLLKIYERAQAIAAEEAIFNRTRSECTATALKLKPKSDIKIEDYYPVFLDMLKNVLDGNMDAGNYEDTLREMYGIHAYIAFTLDRVSIYFLLTHNKRKGTNGSFFLYFHFPSRSCRTQ
jgi:paired amphipathic helix protein Sin3a